jgi:beta-galactosidase
VETTGAASRLTLAVHGDSTLAIVNASALDEQGRRVPVAGNDVTFEVSGPGRITGVGNGDPSSHEPDKFLEAGATWHRKLFNGYAQVIVQRSGPGEIQVRATAAGLQPATITVAK